MIIHSYTKKKKKKKKEVNTLLRVVLTSAIKLPSELSVAGKDKENKDQTKNSTRIGNNTDRDLNNDGDKRSEPKRGRSRGTPNDKGHRTGESRVYYVLADRY